MYRVYGTHTVDNQLKIQQYLEVNKRATAYELARQFLSWGLHPVIIEWRKNWQQGKELPIKEG